jgi:hypothetical protein
VLGVVAARQDAGVDAGMESLHAAAEDLGEAGGLLNRADGHPGAAQDLLGTPRGVELDA